MADRCSRVVNSATMTECTEDATRTVTIRAPGSVYYEVRVCARHHADHQQSAAKMRVESRNKS